MRKRLVTLDEAIECVRAIDRKLSADGTMSAELTETLFCLKHMKDGVNLFGADTSEALFIASNFKGRSDYSEKRKQQLKLMDKYAMRRHYPEDRYNDVTVDDGALDKEEGFRNA